METSFDLDQYVAIAKRRFWYIALSFVSVLGIAVGVVNALPLVYRAEAKIAVESQQIPDSFVRSTVLGWADERIGFVEQRVLTNNRLLGIIDKFDLYSRDQGETPDSVLVKRLRRNIVIDRIRDRSIERRDVSNTVAFTVSFEYGDPDTAAAVANELATMFLTENVKSRTDRATETTEFLKREAKRLGEQVAETEALVAAYKQEHGRALPEHLELRMNMLQSAENSLKDLEREIADLEQQGRFLATQRTTVGVILSSGASGVASALSPAQQLAALKVELAEKSAVYSAAHPDVRSLERRIAQLEREVAAGGASDGPQPSAAMDPARAQIESQIASLDAQMASLRGQKAGLQEKIEDLQARIVETPQVERGLRDLTRDYETALEEYEDIMMKMRSAELAENLEAEEKAERFVLLEQPRVPSVPVRPEKLKLYAMAVVLAGGSGAGSAFIAEFLDATIRGPAMLTSILQRHPLAVIPYIENSTDRRRVRRRWRLFLFGAVVFLLATLVIAHVAFQPLYVVFDSLLGTALSLIPSTPG